MTFEPLTRGIITTTTKEANSYIDETVKKLTKLQAELAQTRDKLRDLESEIGDLLSCSEEASENLEAAIDRLSELV